MLTKMKTSLDGGGRVTILVRHAERPALEPGDRTFGASLPLTANGWRDAQNFGIMLARELRPKSVAFYAGGTFRTLQTACGMAMGLDLAEAGARIERKVRLADFLGSESPFFGSVEERMSLAAQGHYHERLNDYFRNGVQRGYKPLKAAADIMERRLAALHDDAWPLVVAVTHDINIAAFLAARGAVASFTDETWPGYLDAAIIVKNPDGVRTTDFQSSRSSLTLAPVWKSPSHHWHTSQDGADDSPPRPFCETLPLFPAERLRIPLRQKPPPTI